MPSETTIERFREAGLALLPPGRALTKAIDSNLSKLFEAIGVELTRVHEDAAIVLQNSNPSQSSEMLDEWEEALGLPGSCVTTPSTVDSERAGAIVAKLRGRTSHALPTYEAAAIGLGYEDVEYVHHEPFRVGSSAVGDTVYGDNWMHVVDISVPVGDQTADEELTCTFNDLLRRSHGYLDIRLEGVMGAQRTHYANYHNASTLAASITEASITALVELKYQGFLSAQVIINSGVAGVAPTSAPVGTWKLYSSVDGITFTEVVSAEVTAELALIAATGNVLVGAFAVFTNVPGRYVKLAYTRTSGGGAGCAATIHLTTW